MLKGTKSVPLEALPRMAMWTQHKSLAVGRWSMYGFLLGTGGLVKAFKGFMDVPQADLKVRRGLIPALIGLNESGKTTVFNVVTKSSVSTTTENEFVRISSGYASPCESRAAQRRLSALRSGFVQASGCWRREA